MKAHHVWQDIYPPGTFKTGCGHEHFYPARLADGRQILLPVRPLPDGKHALASLIINQASFAVLDALADDLAAQLSTFEPDLVIGLPTLGLTLAAEVAKRLGHSRYIPLGTSRKFWYEEALSVPLSSITTPAQMKRLYVDPRMLPLLENRRIALIDDVISSGRSIRSGLKLLQTIGIRPAVIGAAMLQSNRWQDDDDDPYHGWSKIVRGCFSSPLLNKGADELWHVSSEETNAGV